MVVHCPQQAWIDLDSCKQAGAGNKWTPAIIDLLFDGLIVLLAGF
jgi:hypothetical protein